MSLTLHLVRQECTCNQTSDCITKTLFSKICASELGELLICEGGLSAAVNSVIL